MKKKAVESAKVAKQNGLSIELIPRITGLIKEDRKTIKDNTVASN